MVLNLRILRMWKNIVVMYGVIEMLLFIVLISFFKGGLVVRLGIFLENIVVFFFFFVLKWLCV